MVLIHFTEDVFLPYLYIMLMNNNDRLIKE